MYFHLSFAIATVYKLIMELLPAGVGCSKETRDLLVDCCNEFVHLISSEANDICEKSGRKTIAPEHVIEALRNLGFGEYVEEVQAAHEDHQTQSKEKERLRASSKAEASKLSEEELLKQQEALFEQARLKYMQSQMQNQSQKQSPAAAPGNVQAAPAATAPQPEQAKVDATPVVVDAAPAKADPRAAAENASSDSLELSSS
jgi:histone H3/H4